MSAIRKDAQYLDVSNYAMQLTPYIRLFGKDRIKTLTYEELIRNPLDTVKGIFDWLGVDSSFVPSVIDQPVHVTPEEVEMARGLRFLQKIRRSHFWDIVGPKVPKGLRSIGAQVAQKKVHRSSVSLTAVKNYLKPIQKTQSKVLQDILKRDFPDWTTLYGEECENL